MVTVFFKRWTNSGMLRDTTSQKTYRPTGEPPHLYYVTYCISHMRQPSPTQMTEQTQRKQNFSRISEESWVDQ